MFFIFYFKIYLQYLEGVSIVYGYIYYEYMYIYFQYLSGKPRVYVEKDTSILQFKDLFRLSKKGISNVRYLKFYLAYLNIFTVILKPPSCLRAGRHIHISIYLSMFTVVEFIPIQISKISVLSEQPS